MIKTSKIIPSLLMLGVSAMFLSGCGPRMQSQYAYSPPTSKRGRQCMNHCLRTRNICLMNCNSTQLMCFRDAQRAAVPQYQAYVRRRTQQRKPVIYLQDHFANYTACPSRCGCQHTYQQCFIKCGGHISKIKRCVANCH